MIYVLIGMGFLFVVIGLIVTKNNAQHLLAGYNTMNEDERKNFDIQSYITYFRKFHFFLGASFLLIGLPLYFISVDASGIFLGVYPIIAYIYFIATGSKYSKISAKRPHKIAVLVLFGCLVLVVVLFIYGYRETGLYVDETKIEFTGMYGETLDMSQVETIELVSSLPKIALKTNGFALGTISKGYFQMENGENVKLLLNSHTKPYILIKMRNGKKIYYSDKSNSTENHFQKLQQYQPL
jgi:hypothetical protein